jgi:hypothetical protein
VLEQLSAQLATVYAAATEMPTETIRQLMDDETWYTAEQALAAGFITDIYDAVGVAACFDPQKFHYQNQPTFQPTNHKKTDEERMKEVFAALKVTTESEALQAINAMQTRAVDAEAKITALETKNTDLQEKIADYEAKERAAAVDAAVKAGKILPAQKSWALANFEAFQEFLKTTKPVDLTTESITGSGDSVMSYEDYLNDPAAMDELRATDPELLATLRAEWQDKGGK